MDLAAVEDGFGIAEDKVDVALDVAVGEVLAGGVADAGFAGRMADAGAGVEGVLIAEKTDVAEDFAVASEEQGDCL